MNATEILVPRQGLLVRDPFLPKMPILPAEGAVKPLIGTEGKYWRRRLKVGDVTVKKEQASPRFKPVSDRKYERRDNE